MNSTGMNLHINQLPSETALETNNQSVIEETLNWLEDTDSPMAKALGKGICTLTGLYLVAQFIRAIFL